MEKDYRPPRGERTLKKGQVREDGKVFWSYHPSMKPNGEHWLDADEYDRRNAKRSEYYKREDVKKKNRIRSKIRYQYKMQTDPEYREKLNERNRQRDRSEYWSRQEVKERRKKWERENSEKRRKQQKDRTKNMTTDQRERLNENRRKYRAKRTVKDPAFLMMQRLRERMHTALRQANSKKKSHMMDSIGCTPEFLVKYLEVRFKPGMTWDNYGSEWHIDHVIPLSSFDMTKRSEQMKANHYTNLQPMWATENLAKSNKILSQQDLIKL